MIAQLNCFTFGYLFVELVVGSPVGMRNFIAEVELRQKYQNKEKNPLEVTYFFPVEEEASVIGCKALLDGENIFIFLCSLFFLEL